jgi:hypothetical protein
VAALGIARLDQPVRKDPVKAHAVVVVTGDELLEIPHGARGSVLTERDHDALRLPFVANLHQHHRGPRTGDCITVVEGASGKQHGKEENKGEEVTGIHEPVMDVMVS